MLVFVLLSVSSCLRRNLLKKLDRAMTPTQSALYSLEEGSGEDAIHKLEKTLKDEDRKVLNDPNSTIIEKKDALVRSWGGRDDKDTLYSLYAIASIKREGISLLRVLAFLVASESVSKESVISTLVSQIPFNQKTIQSLDLFMILSDIITTPKSAPVLIKETVIIVINLAARIAVLDLEGSGKITNHSIEKMTSSQADEIYNVLSKAASTMDKAYALNPSELNAKLEKKVVEIKSNIDNSNGSANSDKIKTYLFKLIEKNGPIALGSFLQTYVSKSDAPRISPKKPFNIPSRSELENKYNTYLSQQKLNSNGWITDTKCDGLLFNSLFAVSGGTADIMSAQDKTSGQWFRHPAKDCYPGESSSSISRDMLIGLLIWIWHSKKADVLDRLISYGTAHANKTGDWVMGDEVPGTNAVELNAPFRELVLLMQSVLKGSTPTTLSDEILTPVTGYESHLQVLHFYLQGLLLNGINDVQLALLSNYYERDSRNALFAYLYHLYVDGDMTEVVNILLNMKYFPDSKLPSSAERCEFYLWQRDTLKNGSENPDWLPCPEKEHTHSGVDFLFVASRLLKEGG